MKNPTSSPDIFSDPVQLDYFEQTQKGESRWWSWVAVTWLALAGWVAFQFVLMGIVGIVAAVSEPDLFNKLLQVSEGVQTSEVSQTYSTLTFMGGMGAVAAILTALTASGRIRFWAGVLAGIGIVVSITGTVLTPKNDGSAELMGVIMQIMGASPIAFALFLLTFPAGLIVLYGCQKLVHRRTLTSLHTAARAFRWWRVIEGFLLTWLVLGGFALIAQFMGLMDARLVFDGGRFWIFAAVSLLLIPFQAAAEEIVFRGYFVQGLAHLTRSKWIAFALTSLAFMALHLSNPEALKGAESGTLPIVMSGYLFFGFAMCLLVWLDDGLETAIGVHAGNNCFAAIIMNYENSVLPTPSVFITTPEPVSDAYTTILVLALIVAIIWFRRGGPPKKARSLTA